MGRRYYLINGSRPVCVNETSEGTELLTWDHRARRVAHNASLLTILYSGRDKAGNEHLVEETDESDWLRRISRFKVAAR